MIYLPITPPQTQLPLYILSNPTRCSPLHAFVPLYMLFPLLVPTSFPSLLQSLSYNSLPFLSHPFFNLYSKLKLYFVCSLSSIDLTLLKFFSCISNLFLVMEHISYLCTLQGVAQHMTCYTLNALEILFVLMNTVCFFHHIHRIQSSYKPTTQNFSTHRF